MRRLYPFLDNEWTSPEMNNSNDLNLFGFDVDCVINSIREFPHNYPSDPFIYIPATIRII
jgi:hypothetical protein